MCSPAVSIFRYALLVAAVASGLVTGELSAQDLRQFALTSENGETRYVVDVWLPAEYSTHERMYPVLVMLDGEYAFDSAVQLAAQLQRDQEVQEFIIVGVSYGVGFGKPLAAKRTPDFTPPVDSQGVIRKSETAYYRFIRDRLLPELHGRYRIDPKNRALWGYSLSGSFAAWLNYQDPGLFEHTILASGNLIGFGILQRLSQREIFSGTGNGGRKVFISFDRTEVPDPHIIDDGRRLLSSKESFPGYEFQLLVTEGESHGSSWFTALPASLRFVFGAKRDAFPSKEIFQP